MTKFKCQVGDKISGDYVIVDMGYWDNANRSWKTWYYICRHSCGRTRKFVAHQLFKDKQPCKLCEAGKFRMKETECVILQSEYRKFKSYVKQKGLANELTKEEWAELVMSPCTYCGKEPHDIKSLPIDRRREGRESTMCLGGIDRVNNAFGYILDNVVSCCWKCNRSKNIMSVAEWLDQVELLASRALILRKAYG